MDPAFKDENSLDASNFNNKNNRNNPIRITRITQRDTEIEKQEKKACC